MATDFNQLLTDIQKYLADGQALQQRIANALGELGIAKTAVDIITPQLATTIIAQVQASLPQPVPVTPVIPVGP